MAELINNPCSTLTVLYDGACRLAEMCQSVKPVLAQVTASVANQATSAESTERLTCAQCGSKISFPEGKFCWNNTNWFKGLQYCREHQALF